ncbi:MAG: UDP-N-acetylmuramate dehydrogenase [Prolixibacteraceae bacterium]|nr:UDP-N-acetylmuramate dehydrogenase [Prolixibacteraceae bacterium]
MIRLLDQYDLTAYNTFHLHSTAERFFEFTETEDLLLFLRYEGLGERHLILGGGSNMLFQKHIPGLVIHPNIPGIVEVDEDRNQIYWEAGAGVEWDELVDRAVKFELGGLENLSLIPGKVGAAPVQNIGAYGAEIGERIELVRFIHLESGKMMELKGEDCHFAYRDSIFKNELKNKVVITSVIFRLDKFPEYKLDYGSLKAEVEKLGKTDLESIRQSVISIREAKLPDPKVIGNAGSFFKNPVIDLDLARDLTAQYPHLPVYPLGDAQVKLAAAWLIDHCGWKGYRKGDAGVHEHQALVLVNYGKASGEELIDLSHQIRNTVQAKFHVLLEPEVNIIG